MNAGSGPTTSEPDLQAQPDVSAPEPPTARAVSSTASQGTTTPVTASNSDRRDDHSSVPKDHAADDGRDPDGTRAGGKPRGGLDPEGGQDSGEPAVGARMLAYAYAYARARLAEGAHVTGADLDRHFGTRDYGRRILRRLASEAQAVGS